MVLSIIAEKVAAFVTRQSLRGTELLVFEHPSAGIQIPAGTVEADEALADAAAREAAEETGLLDLPPPHLLASRVEPLPDGYQMVAATTPVYARPDTLSFDWARMRRGILVRCNREGPDFSHITYAERDSTANPPFVSYEITGWVPSAVLTRHVRRSFYHFPYHGRMPETWYVDTDNHRFRLFWAPLSHPPPVIGPQRWWLDVALQLDVGSAGAEERQAGSADRTA